MTHFLRFIRGAMLALPLWAGAGADVWSQSNLPARPAAEPPIPAAQPREEVKTQALPSIRAQLGTRAGMGGMETLALPLNKSRVIDLPADVRDVTVGSSSLVDVVMKTPRQAYLFGKAVGDTNVTFLDRFGQVVTRYEVNVQVDVESVKRTLRELLPDENIQPSAVGDSLFLGGTARSAAAAGNAIKIASRFVSKPENVVNIIKIVGEQQVLLRVRVAEVQKSVLKELSAQTTFSQQNFDRWGLGFTPNSSYNLSANTFGTARLTPLNTASYIGHFSVTFNALEREGLVKSLAEPNLTAESGETASLLAGGEYPIPTNNSNNVVTVEYKPFGVGLAFTPVVLSRDRISLKLSSEVSAIDTSITVQANGITLNAFKVRRAETTVELPSGGSLMIAGLLQNDVTQTLNGLPGIKDIPILGALFRSQSFQRSESELVVMVTAMIVRPVDEKALAMPTDGFVEPSDMDRILFGRLHKLYSAKGPPPKTAIQGPSGYIME